MRAVLFFLVVFVPNVLFGQTSQIGFEFTAWPVISQLRSKSYLDFNKTYTGEPNWGVDNFSWVKWSPNVEKRWIFGIDFLGTGASLLGNEVGTIEVQSDNNLKILTWTNKISGFVGYELIQRKSFGMSIGLSPKLTKSELIISNRLSPSTISIGREEKSKYFRVHGELDMYAKFRLPWLVDPIVPKIRLKYEPSVGFMPSKASIAIAFTLMSESNDINIRALQTTKRSNKVLFYPENMSGYFDLKWDFGDGTNSNEATPEKIYSEPGKYTVNLTASYWVIPGTDDNWSSYKSTRTVKTTVTILKKISPIAFFDFVMPYDDKTVTFRNKSKNGDTYSWIFDDGVTSSEENPTHRFLTKGTFKVKLTVTDSVTGETNTYQQKIKF